MFTNIDTTFVILNKLDDRALFNMCLVNKSINQICNNENFWYMRFVEKFGNYKMKLEKMKLGKRHI